MLPIYIGVYVLVLFLVELYRYKKSKKENNIKLENNKPEQE